MKPWSTSMTPPLTNYSLETPLNISANKSILSYTNTTRNIISQRTCIHFVSHLNMPDLPEFTFWKTFIKTRWASVRLFHHAKAQQKYKSICRLLAPTHTKLLQSYLKDTYQFISEIEQLTIPLNSTIVTIDVKSLYTNIPHNEGIKACLAAFISLERTNPQQPPPEILTNLLEIVLKNNTFEFNNKCYKQLYGTAMETKLAPSYANTFMEYIEDKFLSQQHLVPLYYHWLIDDIFLIWPHPINKFHKFIDKMNKIHPTIKFTHELSQETITFLDTDVHLDDNKLYVTTHINSTNKQAYTHASSYHPPGTGKGIAIGEAKRYARTNTRLADFQNCISKHIQQMKTRWYNLHHTRKLITNIKHCDRSKTNPPRKNLNRPIFVTRYTASAKRIIKTIRKNYHNLQTDPKVGRLFPNYPIMAFRKNKNLRNYLVRAIN